MNNKWISTLAAAFAALLLSTSTQATLIDNGITTYDDVSGLEWLDLTESTGRSVNNVLSHLGTGGDFEGYRYAVIDEIYGLFIAAGIPDVPGTSVANIAPAQALMDLIGHTSMQAGIGDGREAIAHLESGQRVSLDALWSGGIAMMKASASGSSGLDSAFTTLGHWLVVDEQKQTIPEPATLALMSLGLAGIRFKKTKQA